MYDAVLENDPVDLSPVGNVDSTMHRKERKSGQYKKHQIWNETHARQSLDPHTDRNSPTHSISNEPQLTQMQAQSYTQEI